MWLASPCRLRQSELAVIQPESVFAVQKAAFRLLQKIVSILAEKGGVYLAAQGRDCKVAKRYCVQGYLAHKKLPPPVGPPQGPRQRPTVGS